MESFRLRIMDRDDCQNRLTMASRVPAVGEIVYDADEGSHTVLTVNWEGELWDETPRLTAYVVAR